MKFNKQHSIYEKQFFQRLIKEFRIIAKKIPFDSLTETNAENVLSILISEAKFKQILFDTQLSIGYKYGNKVSKVLNQTFKNKKKNNLPLFNEAFLKYLINYYNNEGGSSIVLLTETFIKAVVMAIKNSTIENESIKEMRDRIFKTVNSPNFYKWQALRIARTETTFAMNAAKEVTGEVSGFVLEKIWTTRTDGKERESHRNADEKTVGQNEMFIVGGYKMKYPGDRLNGAPAREIINCRCSFGYRGKKDADGKLIYVDI